MPDALSEGENAAVPVDDSQPERHISERHFRRQLIEDNKFYREQLQRQHLAQQQQAHQLAALVERIAMLTQPPPASPTAEPQVSAAAPAAPPRPETFATHEEFIAALTGWQAQQAVQQALSHRDAQEQQRRQQWEQEQRQQREAQRGQTWQQKLAEGRQQFADFDLVVSNPAASIAKQHEQILFETVLESPHGPAILHYLGSHPEITSHLNQMSPYGAARFLGEIEAHVRPKPAVSPPVAPPVPPVPPPASVAAHGMPVLPPAPLQPVGGGSAPGVPGQFRPDMGLPAYTRMREQQLQRRSA
jgi:hypothetical protein